MTKQPILEVWAGVQVCQIRDVGQEDNPLVCQVPRGATETFEQTLERARMLAEIIEIGWEAKYGEKQ